MKGTLNCFTGRHILLGMLAIVMLLICALLIPFLGLAAIGKLEVCNNSLLTSKGYSQTQQVGSAQPVARAYTYNKPIVSLSEHV